MCAGCFLVPVQPVEVREAEARRIVIWDLLARLRHCAVAEAPNAERQRCLQSILCGREIAVEIATCLLALCSLIRYDTTSATADQGAREKHRWLIRRCDQGQSELKACGENPVTSLAGRRPAAVVHCSY